MHNGKMSRSIVLTFCVAIAVAWTVSAAGCPLSPSTIGEIRDLVEVYIDADYSPGLVLGIRCGDATWLEGFGVSDISTGEPLEASQQFLVASIAKQLVAAVVMRLVEEGRLGLEDPIADYVDYLPEAWTGITIRHCLSHTSGTFSFGGLPTNLGSGSLSRESLIGFITSGRLFTPPGEGFLYSTVGFFLLGYIVEQVTGAPVDDFIEREFLVPLGLEDTGFLLTRSPEDLAGYHQHYWQGQAFFRDPPTTSWGLADGMFSTAEDLLAWQAALASGGIVSNESLALMTTRAATTNAAGETAIHNYGFGLEVFADEEGRLTEVGHWGNGGGHIAYLWAYPQHDISVVALQNSNGRLAPLLEEVEALLVGTRGEKPDP